MKLPASKIIHQGLPTGDKSKTYGININGECHLSCQEEENIDYLFNSCKHTRTIWCHIGTHWPTPTTSVVHFVDWLKRLEQREFV